MLYEQHPWLAFRACNNWHEVITNTEQHLHINTYKLLNTFNGRSLQNECRSVKNQLCTQASLCYPSYQRRLRTECQFSAIFPDKLDRWRHIWNRRGRLGTRLVKNSSNCLKVKMNSQTFGWYGQLAKATMRS